MVTERDGDGDGERARLSAAIQRACVVCLVGRCWLNCEMDADSPSTDKGAASDQDARVRLGLRCNFSSTSTVLWYMSCPPLSPKHHHGCAMTTVLAVRRLCICHGLYEPKHTTARHMQPRRPQQSETADGLPCSVSGPWHGVLRHEPHLVESCGLCACVADAAWYRRSAHHGPEDDNFGVLV